MWRLWHRLFGWHYVHLISRSGILEMVRRVRLTPAGERYVKGYCGGIEFIDRSTSVYGTDWSITPLTWTEPLPEEKLSKLRVVS